MISTVLLSITTIINGQDMDFNILSSFLFHPRKSYQEMDKKDIQINVGDSILVSSRFHLISKSAPTILFFHGNGEIATEYDDIARVYNQKNINFIIADFRGYGFSTGTPDVENTQSDAHFVLDYILKYLKEKNYSGSLNLMGRSLGSVSVLELAKRYPHDFSGLIIESGFADEEPLFKLIGTTAEQAGFTKQDGFLNGDKLKNMPDHFLSFTQSRIILYLSARGSFCILLAPPKIKNFFPFPMPIIIISLALVFRSTLKRW